MTIPAEGSPYSWLEMPSVYAFAELEGYVFDLLDWLGHNTHDMVQFSERADENPDWEIDCWDVYDVLALLDLTGCLDASV